MDNLIIVTPSELEQLIKKVVEDCLSKMPAHSLDPPKEIIDSETLCKRLNLSNVTVIKYRKKGKIPFLIIGDAIRFEWNAVLQALKK